MLAFASSIGCADWASTQPAGIESTERGYELIQSPPFKRFPQIATTSKSHLNSPMTTEDKNTEAEAELQRLNKVLEVAKRNGNQLFIENIEREIAAIERGDNSPLIADYLTDDERAGSRPGREA